MEVHDLGSQTRMDQSHLTGSPEHSTERCEGDPEAG